MDHEKAPTARGNRGKEIGTGDTFPMPASLAAVNMDSPKLWRVFRRFNRNFKRIGRLQEENAALLKEMYRLQGVAS